MQSTPPAVAAKVHQFFLDWFKAQDAQGVPSNFDALCIGDGLKALTLEPGRAVCSFRPSTKHTNAFGTLNGGAIGALQSMASSCGMCRRAGCTWAHAPNWPDVVAGLHTRARKRPVPPPQRRWWTP